MVTAVKMSDGSILYLHEKPSPYQGHKHKLYYFSHNPEGAIDLPEGFEIIANTRNGFPCVRRVLSNTISEIKNKE